MIGWVLYLIRYGDQSGRRWVDQAIAISADSSGTLHKPQRQSIGNVRIWEISMKRRVVKRPMGCYSEALVRKLRGHWKILRAQ